MILYKCHSMLLTNGSARTNPSCDISKEFMSLCSIFSLLASILSNALKMLYRKASDLLDWWAINCSSQNLPFPFNTSLQTCACELMTLISIFLGKVESTQHSIYSSVISVGFPWLLSGIVTNVVLTFCMGKPNSNVCISRGRYWRR